MTPASAFASPTSESDPPRQEPSMEDILASIRRIIADDQTQGTRAAAAPRRAAAPAPKPERPADYGEVLDLARMPAAASFDKAPPMRAEPAAPMRAAAQETSFQPDEQPIRHADPGRTTRSATSGGAAQPIPNGYASPTLVRDVEQSQQSQPGPMAPLPGDRYSVTTSHEPPARTVDDGSADGLMTPALGTSVMSAFETLAATVVLQNSDLLDRVMRELMRPLIKTWLDENLPSLVERLVRSEIERMARGNRN